jgi:photosystem II stability/assembly factor-like uncharacterized protein
MNANFFVAESWFQRVTLVGLTLLAATHLRAAAWVNAVGNLGSQASECGNMCRLFPVPNTDRVIAGVAGAGLWATTNAGLTWAKIGGDAKIRNRPQEILFDPVQTNVFWEVGIYAAPGLFKTTDGGNSFTPLGKIGHNDGLGIDFTDPKRQTLIATGHEAVRKIYKSTDGGESFVEIGTNFPAGTKFTSTCQVLDARTYFVSCVGWGGGEAGIWRTSDGGATWSKVCDQMPNPGGPVLRTTKGDFFWGSNNGGRLLKGSPDGATWSVVQAPGAKAVSPIELPNGQIATLAKNGIIASADGGATWSTISPPPPYPANYHVVGGLVYSAKAGAFYVWFWDCGNVVRTDAIWRYDLFVVPASR